MEHSIECIGAEKAIHQPDGVERMRREYRGLSIHKSYLPVDDDTLATGSFIIFKDTGEYAEYLRFNHSWYDSSGNVIHS